MESNITLYYFIFIKPFSANKQHKYTQNGSKNQSFFYKTNGITHKSTHIHVYYSRPDIAETTITRTMQLVIYMYNIAGMSMSIDMTLRWF